MALFIQHLKAGLIDKIMQQWVFSCAALFHEIQNISHEQAM